MTTLETTARRQRQSRGPKLFAAVIVLAFLLLVAGLWADTQLGLPLSRRVRSRAAWLAGLLSLGALYGLGEMGADWINARDHVHDPLWKRVMHLLALFGFCGGVVAGMIYVGRILTAG